MLKLRTIGRMTEVELLEYHQSLYTKDRTDAEIENNSSYCKSGADGTSSILVQRK